MKKINNYGSKKKKRRSEYLEREAKRKIEMERIKNYNRIMNDKNSTIEDMAKAMGIPLK